MLLACKYWSYLIKAWPLENLVLLPSSIEQEQWAYLWLTGLADIPRPQQRTPVPRISCSFPMPNYWKRTRCFLNTNHPVTVGSVWLMSEGVRMRMVRQSWPQIWMICPWTRSGRMGPIPLLCCRRLSASWPEAKVWNMHKSSRFFGGEILSVFGKIQKFIYVFMVFFRKMP